MTARIVLSCDGHRNGQPCRGAYPSSHVLSLHARIESVTAGWRQTPGVGDICPSGGHDEDQPHERSP